MNTFSVITVSYDSSEVLTHFLESLCISSVTPEEIIVVNNYSTDTRLLSLIERFPSASVVEAPHNPGYGGGMNLGFAALTTETDWVLIVNPDVRFTRASIEKLLTFGETHPSIGIIGPRILEENGETYPSARALPSLRIGIGHALFANIWKNNPWTHAYRQDRLESDSPRSVGWVSGACMLIRTDVFAQLKGFDDNYFMYFEDVDICQRAHPLGVDVVYQPEATITHLGAHSTDIRKNAMTRAHHQSAFKYLSKKYHAWYLWPLRLVLRIGLSARAWWGEVRN